MHEQGGFNILILEQCLQHKAFETETITPSLKSSSAKKWGIKASTCFSQKARGLELECIVRNII